MKESVALAVMEEMGEKIITHDDTLVLRAQKTRVHSGKGRPGGVGLNDEWWRVVPIAIDKEGKQEFTGYWNKDSGEHHGAGWEATKEGQERLQREAGWKESYRRRLHLGAGVWVTLEANQVDLCISNLYENIGSRYKEALGYLVDMVDRGVVRYKPIVEASERRKREAIRNRLKREFKVSKYEHNILFKGNIGQELFTQFRQVAKVDSSMSLEEGTIYLKGFKRYDGQKMAVKYYDIGMREGGEAGQVFKLETTLLKDYFKFAGMGVPDMLEQPVIQERIKTELEKSLEGTLCYVSEGTMYGIQRELGLERKATIREVSRAMLASSMTLSERVAELERKVAEHERRVSELEAKERARK